MIPTLIHNEDMLVEKMSYWFEDPQRGDIAIVYYPGYTESCVKRVIGLPGETVEVKDGKIATVTVGDNSETQGIGSKAIEQLPAKIVEANGLEGVDAVSGATVTSKAIFTAVEDCLEQAK